MKQPTAILIIILALVLVGGIFFYTFSSDETITSYEECIAAGNPIMESYPPQCSANGQTFVEQINDDHESVHAYFQEQLFERGIDNLGAMPIEGFDPNLYLGAFPKMLESDFADTNAIGGMWVYQNNELNFIMDEDEVVTSADGTLNEEGIETLLHNIGERLALHAETNADVDALLASLELSFNVRFPNKIVYGTAQTSDVAFYERDCERRGGTFSECGSPCENSDDICAAVCAYTCEWTY